MAYRRLGLRRALAVTTLKASRLRLFELLACLLTESGVGHRALRRGADQARVFREQTALGFFRRRLPRAQAFIDHVLRDAELDRLAHGIDHDRIAVLDDRDRPADRGLGRDVADDEAVAAAGEPAVRDQRHLAAQAAADDGARRAQHLRHAGGALRPLVTDHDDVAG